MGHSDDLMDISIIIPVHNERHKIGGDIHAADVFLRQQGWRGEILVVDDGSGDRTAEAAEAAALASGAELQVVRLRPHRGKGHAVRQGMLRSRGKHALYIDSGGCIPYAEIVRGIDLIRAGECEIAHASRRLAGSVIVREQRPGRRMSAWLFRRLFIHLLGLPGHLTDTQAGLKIYRGDVGRALYRDCLLDGFLFDAEIILRAHKAGWRIREFPVTWTSDPDSRLKLRWMPFQLTRDLLRLKNMRID